jgi:hypothetical protein
MKDDWYRAAKPPIGGMNAHVIYVPNHHGAVIEITERDQKCAKTRFFPGEIAAFPAQVKADFCENADY